MKIPVYIRIGKKKRQGFKVDAGSKPNYAPLEIKGYGSRHFIPTVSFGIEFEIPDKLFKGAELIIGIVNVGEEGTKIAANFPVPKLKKP